MLKKLLKYNLENIFKFLIIFYSLSIFFGLLTRIFFSFNNSLAMDIIGRICSGTAISMMCSILINNIMRLWVHFKSDFYGDESYLTHTLPVEKKTLYFSKLITSVITVFVSLAVICATVFVAYYSKGAWQMIKGVLLPIADLCGSSVFGIIAVLIFVLFLEFLNILQCGFMGIILGHKMNNAKIGFSVLFAFIAYIISQSIIVVITFIAALFNKDLMNIFVTNTIVGMNAIKTGIYIGIVLYIILAAVFCFINVRIFKKGVNVD